MTQTASAKDLLRVENLEVVYNDVVLVLKGLSLSVRQGGITALLGANGAGKSTTLKAISGLLRSENGEVTAGTVLLDGAPIQTLTPERIVRQGVFQVMEGRRIFVDITVEENLRCGAHTRPRSEFAESLECRHRALGRHFIAGLQARPHHEEVVPVFILEPRPEGQRGDFESHLAAALAARQLPGHVAHPGRQHRLLGHQREAAPGGFVVRVRGLQVGTEHTAQPRGNQ